MVLCEKKYEKITKILKNPEFHGKADGDIESRWVDLGRLEKWEIVIFKDLFIKRKN